MPHAILHSMASGKLKTHRRILLVSAVILILFGIIVEAAAFSVVRPHLLEKVREFEIEHYDAGRGSIDTLVLYDEAIMLKSLTADLLVSYYAVVGAAALGIGLMIVMVLLDTRHKTPKAETSS